MQRAILLLIIICLMMLGGEWLHGIIQLEEARFWPIPNALGGPKTREAIGCPQPHFKWCGLGSSPSGGGVVADPTV
jgi:hypothetical protein